MSSIIILAYKNNQNDLLLVYTQHLHCSYSGKSLAEVYQQHEKEKKDKYNQRAIDIEVFIQSPCLHNNRRDGTRMQQSKQKAGRENSWKTQGAVCIYHNVHKDKESSGLLFWGAPLQYEDFEAKKVMFTSKTSQTLTSAWLALG